MSVVAWLVGSAAAGEPPAAGTGWPGVFGVVGLRDAATAVVCWQDCRDVALATGRTTRESRGSVQRPSRVVVAADGSVGVLEHDPDQLAVLDAALATRVDVALPGRAEGLAAVAGGWWVLVDGRVLAFRGPGLTPAPAPVEGPVEDLVSAGDLVGVVGPTAVRVLDRSGTLREAVDLPGTPAHVALDPAGRLAVRTRDGALHVRGPGGWAPLPGGYGPVAWVPGTPWLARSGDAGVELADPATRAVVPTDLPGTPVGTTADGAAVLVATSFREGWSHVVPVPVAGLLAGRRPLGTQVGALVFADDGSALYAGTWHGLVTTLDPATAAWRSGRLLPAERADREVRSLLPVGDALWVRQPSRLTVLRGESATERYLSGVGDVAPGPGPGEVTVGGGWVATTAVQPAKGEAVKVRDRWPAWQAWQGPDEELVRPGILYRPVTAPQVGVVAFDLATGAVASAAVAGDFAPSIAGGDGAVVGVTNTELLVWRTPDLAPVGRCPLPSLRIAALAVDRAGARAAVADGSEVLLVSLDGCVTRTLTAPDPVASLAFSPDGATLAAGTEGGAVWIWR